MDTIATVTQGGGQAFTWMMIFAVVFFAFGHLAGAVNNFLYWIINPVWIGGTLTIS